MSVTFAQARTIVQAAIADSGNSTFVDQCLDAAQQVVARARRWPELMSRAFFNTEAAYSTGTVATDGTTTVTLTGGTWPSTVATNKHRFAKSYTSPWYTIATRSSSSVVLLAQAYVDDNETASRYVAYRSHYSLASDCDRVEELWVHDGGEAIPLFNAATDRLVSDFTHYPTGANVPCAYLSIERDASGNRQILLGPDTPDDVYRVEYTYRRKITEGTFAGNLDDARFPIILARALALAYAPEFPERAKAEYAKYRDLLEELWPSESESESKGIRIGQGRINRPGYDPSDVWNRGTVGPVT